MQIKIEDVSKEVFSPVFKFGRIIYVNEKTQICLVKFLHGNEEYSTLVNNLQLVSSLNKFI